MTDSGNRDSEKEELEREARFLRRFGIGAVVAGSLMCVPALIATKLGYDMKTLNTAYEMFASVSMLAGFVPFAAGLLSYMSGNVEYIRREKNNSKERKEQD